MQTVRSIAIYSISFTQTVVVVLSFQSFFTQTFTCIDTISSFSNWYGEVRCGTDVGNYSPKEALVSILNIKNNKMKKQFLAIAFAVIAIFTLTASFNAVKAAPASSTISKVAAIDPIAVTGTNAFGTFAGEFLVQRFIRSGDQIVAVGSLTGTFTDILGTVTQVTSQTIQAPVSAIVGSCSILHLELGPLDLDLLGLQIHLDRIVLDITAQAGAGNLLGNLLCAITNLLNGPGSLVAVVQLLNRILGAL